MSGPVRAGSPSRRYPNYAVTSLAAIVVATVTLATQPRTGHTQRVSSYATLSADGHSGGWDSERGPSETVAIGWENEAWTVAVTLHDHDAEFVARLSPLWQVRQALLFRDLPQPDLWLGTDGNAKWGEVNGAWRPEMRGIEELVVDRSLFARSLPIRRMTIQPGESSIVLAGVIDVETLAIVPAPLTYTRLDTRRWRVEAEEGVLPHASVEFDVDEFGFPVDVHDTGRATATPDAGSAALLRRRQE